MMRLLSLCMAAGLCSAQLSGEAKTTRYWDACAPSCVWDDKAPFASLLQSVTRSGAVSTEKYAPSGCTTTAPNARFADPKQQPIVLNENLSLGYAAVGQLNGVGERELCCSCMELTFTSAPVFGKRMVVQITNTGGDLSSNHFDLQIPGGGVGIFTEGVKNQFGPNYSWGKTYGGVSSMEECLGLPAVLHPGCRWRFDWFRGADNPSVSFRQVQCPKQLTDVSKCMRSDEGQRNFPVVAQTTPAATVAIVKPVAPPAAAVKWGPPAACSNKAGQQCGGKNFRGNKCCPSGLTCTYVEPYWSSCRPKSSGTGPKVEVGVLTPPANTQQQCSNAKYSQCGGLEYKGPKCCAAGSACKVINNWYSQCL